jgi:RNA polymerase sigma factor (sigma-70 family)
VTIPDSELIARVLLNDDRNAFAALVLNYQSNVRGLLRKLSQNNHALADDLAQETFIKAYQSLASFRKQAKFSTWLHRIAYNIFISHARNQRPQEIFDEGQHGETGRNNNLSGVILKYDLETAMRLLTDNERIAIQFCYQCGFSHSEAADILDQPVGTIKTHIARGKEKLRQALSAWQEGVA